jgi:hypothetical protein
MILTPGTSVVKHLEGKRFNVSQLSCMCGTAAECYSSRRRATATSWWCSLNPNRSRGGLRRKPPGGRLNGLSYAIYTIRPPEPVRSACAGSVSALDASRHNLLRGV